MCCLSWGGAFWKDAFHHVLPPPADAAAYYRGAQGIILVYDVTRRETFESLEEVWLREVDMYATVEDAVKMVVANKTDLVGGCWAWMGLGHAGPWCRRRVHDVGRGFMTSAEGS